MSSEIKSFYSFFKKYWILALISLILSPVAIVPIKSAIAIHLSPVPQAFLVLGGDPKREEAVAELANWYPKLDIWISSGPNAKETQKIFQAAVVSLRRLHIDQRAVDTLTNFTTLVKDFQKKPYPTFIFSHLRLSYAQSQSDRFPRSWQSRYCLYSDFCSFQSTPRIYLTYFARYYVIARLDFHRLYRR